ncbi:MAG: hypothetical protein LBC09_00145 [Helicobacteraceae bacterium]|jgi:hypothetical protein|nr:hypothetical protein [Helicobacteraceae bacterium]
MNFVTVSYIVATSIIAAFFVISAFIILARKYGIVKRPLAPFVISGTLFCMFAALVAIVVVSQSFNPAVNDRRYMLDYQNADRGFNQITEAQALFESLYDAQPNFANDANRLVELTNARGETKSYPHSLIIGKNSFNLTLRDKSGALVEDANISALISSMDGSFEQEIASSYEAPAYNFGEFDIAKEGRYRVTIRVIAPQATAYFHRELYAR